MKILMVSKEREAGRAAAAEVVFGKPYMKDGHPELEATYRGVALGMTTALDLGTLEMSFCTLALNEPLKSKGREWRIGFREEVDKIARERFKVELLKNGEYKIG